MTCRFCGADITNDLLHDLRCDGRQGRIEAATPLVPYEPHTHVRKTDPDTSRAAAESVEATIAQRRVWEIHIDNPDGLTDQELLREYVRRHGPTPDSTPRNRRHDLSAQGFIVDSGERRKLTSGRNGVVWRLATTIEQQGRASHHIEQQGVEV